ncbi:aspartate aminotransferase family protein [Flaviaesturariibacter aridisoli]|uniref:Aspartate aminotransferase family protein n=1 Tax=Flaviaesturariibacter aridisoli TaxID=2545761 RepID=A0A4R4E3W3_9BACT|nr:aminotransferase class III-fold pyridoxal phosphate-dependent enzyme [Flaviaesturariibacter aridisoli]TCZ73523.1 aspartate aminotransferase family protein [Flaviaesturariibacter aridisoli]
MNLRQLFLQHVAQTSTAPLALEIVKAEGCTLYGAAGEEWLDLIGGISVANVGHRHPAVLEAVRTQLDAYLHVMVYGEFVQSPQVRYAEALAATLPETLGSVYFTNSGAEAVEGAMKLAKRVTGRTEIVAFEDSYHGSTQGALSIIGSEYWRNAYRPLLPGVHHARYNDLSALDRISTDTACVIAETVQAEAGVLPPSKEWLQALRARCTETGTLLILDEIQAGFGRTGTLWAFEAYGVVPDVLLLGKALGGGMPLGAFIASKEHMDHFADAPVLGHITTFGGHPVCCAAGLAAFEALRREELAAGAAAKGAHFEELLRDVPGARALHRCGLWLALRFESFEHCKAVIDRCIAAGVLTDWFLFASDCLRISPPLTISEEEIRRACTVIRAAAEA